MTTGRQDEIRSALERLAAEGAEVRAAPPASAPGRATPDKPRRIGIAELRVRLGVCTQTVANWTKAGRFPRPHYLNGMRRWWLAEVEAWEREHVTAEFGRDR
jgi:predicted DNA-binding transcriptional regulator AlpA